MGRYKCRCPPLLFTTYHLLMMSLSKGQDHHKQFTHDVICYLSMGQYRDALHHAKPFTHDVICQRVNTGMPYTAYHLLMMSLSTGQHRDTNALHHELFTNDVIVNLYLPIPPPPPPPPTTKTKGFPLLQNSSPCTLQTVNA